jgi:hypothetical protein
LPRLVDAYSRSPDSSTVFVVAFDESTTRELIAVDTRKLLVKWREKLSNAIDPRHERFAGMAVYGDLAFSVSPDGRRIFLASATRDGVTGVGVLDAESRNALGMIGPLRVQPGGISRIPPSPMMPAGATLMIGRRSSAPSERDWLFIINPATLDVIDSAAVAPPSGDAGPTLFQVVGHRDGRHAYLVSRTVVYRYDLLLRVVDATAPRQSNGYLVLSTDGTQLYMTDPGDRFNTPGTGHLYVYDADLGVKPPLDLRSMGVAGEVPVIASAAVGANSDTIYVATGTASRGPTFGTQPLRLLVVHRNDGRLLTSIRLDDWNPGPVFVQPR